MRFLLPFMNDSTLIFAATMREKLKLRGHEAITAHFTENETPDVSERQLSLLLPDGPDLEIEPYFFNEDSLSDFDAVITSMPSRFIRERLKNTDYRRSRQRPAYIAFYAGLDFTPEKGFANRRFYDAIFFTQRGHIELFSKKFGTNPSRYLSFGHPYFMRREAAHIPGKNIIFFTQAVSPPSLPARRFIVDMLATLADRYPEYSVEIKLRHLPGENTRHKHVEGFPYPWIMERHFQDLPKNVIMTDRSTLEALSNAAYAITCTSTAAMDAIAARVPTFVYLDYPENYLDPLVTAMRKEFSTSGLIARLHDIMLLEAIDPDEGWVDDRFRGADLFEELELAVSEFKQSTES